MSVLALSSRQMLYMHVLLTCLLQQLEFDQLQANLQMEATTAKEAMRIDWKSEVTLLSLC